MRRTIPSGHPQTKCFMRKTNFFGKSEIRGRAHATPRALEIPGISRRNSSPDAHRDPANLATRSRGRLGHGERPKPCVVRTTMIRKIEVPIRRGKSVGRRRKRISRGREMVAVTLESSGDIVITPIGRKQVSHSGAPFLLVPPRCLPIRRLPCTCGNGRRSRPANRKHTDVCNGSWPCKNAESHRGDRIDATSNGIEPPETS